jgi:hypothetical protein
MAALPTTEASKVAVCYARLRRILPFLRTYWKGGNPPIPAVRRGHYPLHVALAPPHPLTLDNRLYQGFAKAQEGPLVWPLLPAKI